MKKTLNIAYLYPPVATCPQCKGQLWFIHLNGFFDQFDKVTAHECSDCGYKIEIDVEVVVDGKNS